MNRVRRRPPIIVVTVAVFTVVLFALPLVGLFQRASWSTFIADLTTPEAVAALRLSMLCSVSAAGLSVLLGFPLAWTLLLYI